MGIDVVTGGNGFIGSALVKELRARGRMALVADLPECDIRDEYGWRFDDEIDTIYHLAALADIVPSIENPAAYYETNVTGTFNMLEVARKHGCKKFVYAASASCYGMGTSIAQFWKPSFEGSKIDPQYPYALTKYLGEQLVMHWSKVYGIPTISLRLFNVYGPGMRATNAYGGMFKVFLAQLANNKPITIVGDGSQMRDFVHVDDVVRAFILAAESNKTGKIYNVGSGNPVSVSTIADLLRAMARVYIPERPGEPHVTWADITNIKDGLGWEPHINIADGVSSLAAEVEYYRDAPVWTPESIEKATDSWFRRLSA